MDNRNLPSARGLRAVFLDFYGTVVAEDNPVIGRISTRIAAASPQEPAPREIWSFWYQEFLRLCRTSYGLAFRLERALEMESMQRTLDHFAAPLDAEEMCQGLFDYWARPDIFQESPEAIEACPLTVCLVSNVDNADLASALAHAKLSFEFVVTSEDVRGYKPRPEMFARALSLLGVRPDEALHVGDSLSSDVAGAKAAGIAAVWINRDGRNIPPGGQKPDYVWTDLSGLGQLVREED